MLQMCLDVQIPQALDSSQLAHPLHALEPRNSREIRLLVSVLRRPPPGRHAAQDAQVEVREFQVRAEVGAQVTPLTAVEIFDVREGALHEFHTLDGCAGRGCQVAEEGDDALGVFAVVEDMRAVEDGRGLAVDLPINAEDGRGYAGRGGKAVGGFDAAGAEAAGHDAVGGTKAPQGFALLVVGRVFGADGDGFAGGITEEEVVYVEADFRGKGEERSICHLRGDYI